MKFSTNNFFYNIKQVVMGGGREKDGTTPRNDAGFLKDINYALTTLFSTPSVTNAVKQTFTIPVQLSDLVNSATWKIAVPFAATVNSALFRTGKPASTSSKAATLTVTTNGGTAVTGGVISLTTANQNTTGGTAAATAISGAGATITAGQTIEFAVSSVTAFVEGDGYVEFTVTNNDLTNLLNGTAAETNLKVVQIPASNTSVGTVNLVIPRDYDEATDSFALHLGVAMSGSTDTPGLTATVYKKTPGSAIATVATSVAAKIRGGTSAAALSSTEKVVIFDFGNHGLVMDDAITIVISSDAHTTDAINVYYVQPVYRSTLVAYHESTGGTRDGKDGTFLR